LEGSEVWLSAEHSTCTKRPVGPQVLLVHVMYG